jgi:hypothetical protein
MSDVQKEVRGIEEREEQLGMSDAAFVFFFPPRPLDDQLLNSQLPRDPLFLFSFNSPFCLIVLFTFKMVFWREVGLQLRRVPKTDICLTQSRRYLSSSRTWTNTGITTQPRSNTARRSLQSPWQGYNAARRAFSVSAQAAHGHITPPKAGEE